MMLKNLSLLLCVFLIGNVFSQEARTCNCPNCKGEQDFTKIASINRFKPDDEGIVLGKYVYKNNLNNNPIYMTTGFIDISDAPAGSQLKMNKSMRFVSFYDKDKKYLDFAENKNITPIPAGSAYARIALTQVSKPGTEVYVVPPTPKAAKTEFVNDICMPSKLYMLDGVQNDIFVQPFLKRWRPYDDFVRFSATNGTSFVRRLSTVASIQKPIAGSKLTVELVNSDDFETIKSQASALVIGKPGIGEETVTAQIIGDSFTHGRFFHNALLKQDYVPKLKLIGLRICAAGQYDEGRGGWTLDSYFTVQTREGSSYHGYMHPEGDFRYYGAKKFWKKCWTVFNKTAPDGFEPRYSCGRFDYCLDRFDPETGALKAPQKGDVQFDNDNNCFILFDGEQWLQKKQEDFKWSFNYTKYLDMWKLEKPQFLFVLLGINDFCNKYGADFTQWNKQITIAKDSYLKACPDGKFVICIPCSTLGSIDNIAGNFTVKQNAAMWQFRQNLIKYFDNREKDGFYLLDTGVATDNEHGYTIMKTGNAILPFDGYSGDAKLTIQTGNPHPYANYVTMGIPIAAFIQANRNIPGK